MKPQSLPHMLYKLALCLALFAALAGCSQTTETPTRAPQLLSPPAPTALPKQPEPTLAPSATAQPTTTAVAATPTPVPPTPAPTATLSPVDRRDPQAIIDGVRKLVEQKDSSLLAALLGDAPNVNFARYIEGSQLVDRAKLQADLNARLSGSKAVCDGYSLYENTLQVWTSGWAPDWQMDSQCYIGGCATLPVPWKSARAGFFFNTDAQGAYRLTSLWLNDNQIWKDVYKVRTYACGQAFTASLQQACPNAPKTRLKIGEQVVASTATTASSRIRSAPGMGANILGLLGPGKSAEIVGGPACADTLLWWKIKPTQGSLGGWAAEGQGSEYFLVPCSLTGGCSTP